MRWCICHGNITGIDAAFLVGNNHIYSNLIVLHHLLSHRQQPKLFCLPGCLHDTEAQQHIELIALFLETQQIRDM